MFRAAVSLALLLAVSTAAGQAPADSWLSWSAPPECQNTAEVERRLTSLLDHPLDTTRLPASRAALAWVDGQGWQLDVAVDGYGARHRRVVVQIHRAAQSPDMPNSARSVEARLKSPLRGSFGRRARYGCRLRREWS